MGRRFKIKVEVDICGYFDSYIDVDGLAYVDADHAEDRIADALSKKGFDVCHVEIIEQSDDCPLSS